MRVLYLNAYGNGSTGRIVDSLKNECAMNNIEAISIYARERCDSPDTSIRCFNRIGFYNDVLMTRILDNHGLNNFSNTRHILRIIDEFQPDIIHIHNIHGYWMNYKMLFKYIKTKKIRVIWTFHDCWNFTGHCTHFDYIECEKWKTGCYQCPLKTEYPAGHLFDGSRRNYREKQNYFTLVEEMIIVTPSEWLADKVKSSFLKNFEIKVINNGIDISKFRYLESGKRKSIFLDGYDCIILAVASDWNEKKGLQFVLEMAKMQKNWKFVIIGNIHNKVYLEKASNLLFINRTDDISELAEWYSAADVFVNPTLEDTYPTTNLEAIACETPVVTFPTGGSVEIVRKTNMGKVTKSKTTSALIDAINACINDKIICDKEKVEKLLDAKSVFSKYIDIYLNGKS